MRQPSIGETAPATPVGRSRVDVIALVASAGGLEAVSAVLRELPADLPAAVLVAQHLSGQGSGLVQILARRTALPVRWAADGARLQPGQVLVAPPLRQLEVMPDGTVTVSRTEVGVRHHPLDALLVSLADSCGPRALGAVLTGMGKDGAVGARALQQAGGIVVVQSEETAAHPSMPRGAIDAGVDLVLPLDEIGKVIRSVVAGGRLPRPRTEVEAAEALFSGPGEVRKVARALDWSTTPLGPVSGWPEALRLMVRTTLDSAYPMAVWWGPELIQVYNERWREFLGASKHPQALGGRARETWPEIWAEIGPMAERVMTLGEAVGGEDSLLFIERHGYLEEVFVTFSYAPIRDADGAVVGVHNTGLDTTRNVVAERRMRALRTLAAQVGGAGTPRQACERAAAALASDPADLPFALLYLLDDSRRHASLAAAAGLDEGSFAAPRLIDLGGRGRAPAWPLARALSGEAGRPGWPQGVLLDDLAERFRGLAPPPTPGTLSPHSAFLLPLPAAADEPPAGVLVAALSPHRPFDEAYRSFLDLVAAQIGVGLIQARARQRERERLDRLAEIDRAKTEFFSNVSHELRTPLTLLLAPLEELLRRREELPAALAGELEVAARNARCLLQLVDTLLDFSQLEAGRLRVRCEPTDLAALTAGVASVFRSAAERAGLRLAVDCPPLPEPVWVDRRMWEQVVSNLLSNALKFTFEGEIAVELRAQSMHAELVVRDTGVGIPEEELPHVFKRFHRVRGTRARTQEGSGIGLALVEELVRRHQGRIRTTSQVGSGTTFKIWIPYGRRRAGGLPEAVPRPAAPEVAAVLAERAERWTGGDDAAGPPPAEVLEDPLGAPGGLLARAAGARVLVADDNADLRAYIRRLLAPHWTVETAADGAEALARARAHPPDLLLADVMMPSLDGFGLLREIRGDDRLQATPVVLVTARAGEEAAVEGLLAGADDYLTKPFSARELVARVGAQLELARVRREADAAIAERERRMAELLAAIAAELRDTQFLRNLAARLVGDGDVEVLYREILAAAISLTQADGGTVQGEPATQERGAGGEGAGP